MSDALKPGQPVRNAKTERHGILVGQHPDRHNPGAWNVMADPAAAILDLWLAHHIEPVDVLPEWASWVIPPGHRALPEVDLDKVAALVDAHKASGSSVVLPAPPEGKEWRLLGTPPENTDWRLMPDDWHELVMRSTPADPGSRLDRYQKLNAEPEQSAAETVDEIGPGMWVTSALEDPNEWRNSYPRFLADVLPTGEFLGYWTVGEHDDQYQAEIFCSNDGEVWRRCTSEEIPGNAAELYELLGYEKCECGGAGWVLREGEDENGPYPYQEQCRCDGVGYLIPKATDGQG